MLKEPIKLALEETLKEYANRRTLAKELYPHLEAYQGKQLNKRLATTLEKELPQHRFSFTKSYAITRQSYELTVYPNNNYKDREQFHFYEIGDILKRLDLMIAVDDQEKKMEAELKDLDAVVAVRKQAEELKTAIDELSYSAQRAMELDKLNIYKL